MKRIEVRSKVTGQMVDTYEAETVKVYGECWVELKTEFASDVLGMFEGFATAVYVFLGDKFWVYEGNQLCVILKTVGNTYIQLDGLNDFHLGIKDITRWVEA